MKNKYQLIFTFVREYVFVHIIKSNVDVFMLFVFSKNIFYLFFISYLILTSECRFIFGAVHQEHFVRLDFCHF